MSEAWSGWRVSLCVLLMHPSVSNVPCCAPSLTVVDDCAGRPAKPFTAPPKSVKAVRSSCGVSGTSSAGNSQKLDPKLGWPEDAPLWYVGLAESCWSVNPKQRPSFRRLIAALASEVSA